MNTFNVLDRSLSIHKHHLIEASAGTGKTFSIENLVTRFLVEQNPPTHPPLTIDKILIVTFTRAAASDLRTRIRSRIDQTISFLSLQDPNCPDYVLSWIEQGQQYVTQAKKRLEQALFHFDGAPIFTIHGFCSKMLRRYALEGKMGLDAFGGEESLPTTEMLAVIRDFFRTGVTLDAYSTGQLDIILKGDPDQRKLLNLLKKNCPILAPRPFSAVLPQFQEAMKRLKVSFPATAADLINEFSQQATSYKNYKSGETKAETRAKVERFSLLFNKDTWDADDFDILLEDGLVWVDALDPTLLKSKQTPLPRYPDFTNKLKEELYLIVHEARDFSSLLARLAYDCQKVLDRYRKDKERLNPDDLLAKMFDALSDEAFSSQVRSLFQAAIIDEFQDTDPLQWQIFRRLFLEASPGWPGYLYLVGDPKQSIYAFRQADIYTYLSAGNALGKDAKATLNTNYRSQSSLVHALNTLFSNDNTPDWIPLPRLATSLKYHTIQPSPSVPTRCFDDGRESLHFFVSDKGAKLEECEKEDFFPFIANEIAKLHDEHSVPHNHFAVLVKDRYQGARLAAFLKAQNIPFVNQRSGSLASSPAIPALIDLIQATLHPRDLSAVKTALGGCLIGWNEKLISQFNLEMAVQDPKVTALFQFYTLRQHLLYEGFSSFFQRFLQSQWDEDGKTISERLLSLEGGIDLYHELQQISDVLTEEQQDANLSPERLIALLDQFAIWEENDDHRAKALQDPAKQGVQILTLHFSKGLEFGIVFALGLVNRSSIKDEVIPVYRGETRVLVPIIDDNDPFYLRYCEEIDAEKMRQLYVAMTRAKDRLYLPIALQGKKGVSIGEASPMELFLARFHRPPLPAGDTQSLYTRIREEDGSALIRFIDNQGKMAGISYSRLDSRISISHHTPKVDSIILNAPSRMFVPQMSVATASFTTLASSHQCTHDFTPPHDRHAADKTRHTLPASSETGLLFHHILEKIPFHSFKGISTTEEAMKRINPFLQGSPLEEWKEVISAVIFDAMKTSLHRIAPGFCLADLQPSQIYREMPFLFSYEESVELEELESAPGFLKGVIDLIFTWNGKYYIADWKSNWLGENLDSYHSAQLEMAMHQHQYFMQGNIYSEAWRRYLQLVDPRPFEECFGGVVYLFLRGLNPQHSTGIYFI